MKNFKKILLCAIILFVTLFVTGQCFPLAHDNYLGFLVLAAVVYIHLRVDKEMNSRRLFFYYILSFVVLNIIVRSLEGWTRGLIGAPNILFILLGVISGYLIYSGTTARRFILPGLFLVLALCQAFIFHPYWVHYANYYNFTGKTKENIVGRQWRFRDEQGRVFTKDHYRNKIVLLDFWNTGCGICFAKFPQLEDLYRRYKNNPLVMIQAVNIPLERDTAGMAFGLIHRKQYSFPVVIGMDDARDTWRIHSIPTVVVFYGDYIIYRGDLEHAKNVVQSLLQKQGMMGGSSSTFLHIWPLT